MTVEPGFRVVHVDAGPPAPCPRRTCPASCRRSPHGVVAAVRASGDVDALHANYWLSGVAGHAAKHELDLPLVSTFHTLARVKAEGGDAEPDERVRAETDVVVACSDAILANGPEEAADLGATTRRRPSASRSCRPASTTRSSPPATATAPGRRSGGRSRGASRRPAGAARTTTRSLLFVGRIQPLKGLDVAVRALAALGPTRRPSSWSSAGRAARTGPRPGRAPTSRPPTSACADRIRFVPPQPHHLLSTWYRAADVVVVPSRSESFGLVALEAAACGRPVVAVGGRRPAHHRRGRPHRLPRRRARPRRLRRRIGELLADPARRRPWAGPGPSGPGASRGRRPPPASAGSTPTSPPGPSSSAERALGRAQRTGMSADGDGGYPSTSDDLAIPPASPAELDALEARDRRVAAPGPGREPDARRRRPGRAGRAAVVRPPRRRGEGLHHRLAHARPAGAALRDLRDAGARGERRPSSTPTCCAATARSTAWPSPSARRRRCSSSAPLPARRRRARPSSTGSSARRGPTSSAASGRRCASASPPASEVGEDRLTPVCCISCHPMSRVTGAGGRAAPPVRGSADGAPGPRRLVTGPSRRPHRGPPLPLGVAACQDGARWRSGGCPRGEVPVRRTALLYGCVTATSAACVPLRGARHR